MALVELDAREGRIAEALKLAAELTEKNADSAIGRILTGDVYMRSKQYDKAEAAYQEARTIEDTGVIALRLYNAGQAAGRTGDALARLQTWVDRNDNVSIRHVLASSYIANGRHDDAIRESEKLLKIDGDNPVLLNNLAWLYDVKGDARAVTLAEKALTKAPKSPEIMDTVGWILTRKGDANRGLELLQTAHQARPKQGDIAYHLAVALDRAGRTMEAKRTLRRIFKANIKFSEIKSARELLKKLGG